jgi:hypothetical protein
MIRKSVAEILTRHVTFELEAIDRTYLNAYVPSLQAVRPDQMQLIFDRRVSRRTLHVQYKKAKVKQSSGLPCSPAPV